MITTINTLLHPLHLSVLRLGGILALAVIAAAFTSRRRAAPAPVQPSPKRGSAWAAFLAVGAVAAAFVFAHSRTTPPPAAAAPKPAPVHTEVIKQITTRVASHSPLNGVEITIIAVVLAGTCIAIWVNRQRSA